MRNTLIALGATTLLLAACGQADTPAGQESGPVVAAPESPMNPAIDTADTAQTGTLTPGASSFTSTQARQAIEGQGYTNVGEMTQDAQGIWSAPATKDGVQTTVSVDYQGVVTAR
jgi:ABC-type glycerol-3-phosphate transport system substrate-binding protein